MSGRSKGYKGAGRNKFRKNPRNRGLTPVARSVQEIPTGVRVTIVIDPGIQKGQPHHRYQGRVGVIYGRRGRAYMVNVRDGGNIKKIVTGPEHLKLVR
jgi:large subunit ribosomal protein L21e